MTAPTWHCRACGHDFRPPNRFVTDEELPGLLGTGYALEHWFGPMDTALTTILDELGQGRPPILYQYTDSTGFIGLVQSGSIWATHALFQNDRSELLHLDEVIAGVAESLAGQATSTAARRVLEALSKPSWRYVRVASHFYVACFTTEFDQLSQWRAYAGDGLGYAVGFSTDQAFHVRDATATARLIKVLYAPKDKARTITPILEEIVRILNKCPESDHEVGYQRGIVAAYDMVGSLGAAFKNEGFGEEKEWRLVVSDLGTREMVRYRPGRFDVTPYVELHAGAKLPIVELFLGPRLYEEQALIGARGFLERHGYKERYESTGLRIGHSKASYRGGRG